MNGIWRGVWPWSRAVALLALFVLFGGAGVAAAGDGPTGSWPVIAPGDQDLNSVDVTMVQYLLRGRGYRVRADGTFGGGTRRQVTRFQHSAGIKATGAVDGPTWRRLIVPLRWGSRGPAVLAAQAALQQSADERLPLDGFYGSRTERAVRQFQREHGLHADGVVGESTWLRLTDPVPD